MQLQSLNSLSYKWKILIAASWWLMSIKEPWGIRVFIRTKQTCAGQRIEVPDLFFFFLSLVMSRSIVLMNLFPLSAMHPQENHFSKKLHPFSSALHGLQPAAVSLIHNSHRLGIESENACTLMYDSEGTRCQQDVLYIGRLKGELL